MRRLVGFLCLTAFVGAACGDGSGGTDGCTELREPLDPASGVHLLDSSDVSWQTDPPTSGPHYSVPGPTGALSEPLDRATQVTILEGGAALVQYDEGLTDDETAALVRLAGEAIVVAPGGDLPAPIVATAWTWKLSCDSLDPDRIEEFARARVVDAPVQR